MSQSLPCLFSQSSPLYDVQASSLFVLAVLPPVRSPSLHPGTSNRCPRDLEGTPCGHLCGAAEEQGELSWPNMLIHQDTSPFGLASTFRFSWRLVIQDFFEARHVAKLAGRADTWQTGNCGQPGAYPGLTPVVSCLNQPISMFLSNNKEGPIRIPETVPLDRPHYGKWRHVCPQGNSNPCRSLERTVWQTSQRSRFCVTTFLEDKRAVTTRATGRAKAQYHLTSLGLHGSADDRHYPV